MNPYASRHGTREWSDFSYNIARGCSHGCLYCYAREIALRNRLIATATEWTRVIIEKHKVAQSSRHFDGTVMFPTCHDITPEILPAALKTINNLLSAGNRVLVVTKPHLAVIVQVCQALRSYRSNLEFRFTIGSLNESTCRFWEPGAPPPKDRIESLQCAFNCGFQTSVSIEPMLGSVDEMVDLVRSVDASVTNTIWLGKMNNIAKRVDPNIMGAQRAIALIREQQSDENILRLHSTLKDNQKIRWKDSIKEVLHRYAIAP